MLLPNLFTFFTFFSLLNSTKSNSIKFTPNYKSALNLSLLFYEAQRSGHLPATNRIPWRGDSALNDRGTSGEDLTGGYYDASDFVKFSFTMTFTTTMLAWGMLSFKKAYVAADQYETGLATIKWATDYFIKCHVKPAEFYGQVGDFNLDHTFWGRPEDMNMSRPVYKIDADHPGSDLAGEAAAALAAASLLFKETDAGYSRELVRHSVELFEFATSHRGLYHNAIPGAKSFYESTGYGDELTWAAIWLYRATRDVKYIEQAEQFYATFRINDRPNEFFYNKKVAGIQLLLAEDLKQPSYTTAVKNFCDYSITDQTRTPLGLIFIDKEGTLSHAANVAFICLQASLAIDVPTPSLYRAFARQQIDYILGAPPGNRSFLVGFGASAPRRPHHAASSCPDRPHECGWKDFQLPGPNPQTLYGALVSGPDRNDHYEDDRQEFLYNEVTLDYNAGFQSALAGLIYCDLEKIM